MACHRRVRTNKGSGLINTLINKLPVELHLPGYQFCGPGTRLGERVKKGERGINPLDSACREHDIAYDRSNSIEARNEADHVLENRAWERVKAKDSNLKEKAAAWAVTNIMKAKRRVGAGCGFKAAVKAAKNVLKKNVGEKNLMKLMKMCVTAAKKVFPRNTSNKKIPRVIPIPKRGGMLPLIPIFAGLSALGALTGGISNVVKTVGEFNRTSPSHLGNGLYLTPHRGGSYKLVGKGLFVKPFAGAGSCKKRVKKKTKKN